LRVSPVDDLVNYVENIGIFQAEDGRSGKAHSRRVGFVRATSVNECVAAPSEPSAPAPPPQVCLYTKEVDSVRSFPSVLVRRKGMLFFGPLFYHLRSSTKWS
jgi:hypothetical protein